MTYLLSFISAYFLLIGGLVGITFRNNIRIAMACHEARVSAKSHWITLGKVGHQLFLGFDCIGLALLLLPLPFSSSGISIWWWILLVMVVLHAFYHSLWLFKHTRLGERCVEIAGDVVEEFRYTYDGFFEGIFEAQAEEQITVTPSIQMVGESRWPPFTSPPIIQD
jgi:hypothetical protein